LGGEGNSLRGDGLDKSLNEHARRKPLPCESLPCPLLVMAVLVVSLSFEPALRPNTHNTEAPWPQAQTQTEEPRQLRRKREKKIKTKNQQTDNKIIYSTRTRGRYKK
jgi:hypothetical protein